MCACFCESYVYSCVCVWGRELGWRGWGYQIKSTHSPYLSVAARADLLTFGSNYSCTMFGGLCSADCHFSLVINENEDPEISKIACCVKSTKSYNLAFDARRTSAGCTRSKAFITSLDILIKCSSFDSLPITRFMRASGGCVCVCVCVCARARARTCTCVRAHV